MDNIKILRLKTGEDIIATTNVVDECRILVKEPMIFGIQDMSSGKKIISMEFWLPINVIDVNESTVWENDILTTIEPSSQFKEFYINSVQQFHASTESYVVGENTQEIVAAMSELQDAINANNVH